MPLCFSAGIQVRFLFKGRSVYKFELVNASLNVFYRVIN